jgi:holo-[acyl-carrier protein] synthase
VGEPEGAHFVVGPAGERPGRALVGLDLIEIERFRRALERHPALEQRVFTPAEISYCRARAKPALHLAARFAAKEAVGKLLGTGIVSWQEVEVLGDLHHGGPTRVTLGGRAAERAAELGVADLQVSLSHVDTVAGACLAVVARP